MFARTRLSLISPVFVLLLVAALSSPSRAQIHGVAPSVASFGFGGSSNPTPGTAASVSSVGPNGFVGGPFIPMNCCFGPFISPFQGRGFDGHPFHHHHRFPIGEMMPAFIPYAVPYPVPYDEYDMGDDYGANVDSTYSRGVPVVYDRGPWYRDAPAARHAPAEAPAVHKKKDVEPPAVIDRTASVATQPATVLVYKDGHKMEVQNYAIVGETLFDFAGSLSHKIQLADLDLAATQKTNDDRGVDFQIPAPRNPGQ